MVHSSFKNNNKKEGYVTLFLSDLLSRYQSSTSRESRTIIFGIFAAAGTEQICLFKSKVREKHGNLKRALDNFVLE